MNQPFYLRKLWVKSKLEKRIMVTLSFNIITLKSGCRALADKGHSEHQRDWQTIRPPLK